VTRHYSSTSRGQVHWLEEGEGETVVLLHNLPVSAALYSKMIPILAEKYHVVAPDLPGFGNSDPLPPGFQISDIAEVLQEVFSEAGIRNAKMFGIHTGAVVVTELARNWPDLVESGVLAGFPYVTSEELDLRLKWIEDQLKGLPGGLPIMQPAADGTHVHKRWAAAFSRICWGQGRMPELELSPDEIEFAHMFLTTAIASWQTTPQAFSAAFSYDADALLPSVAAPMLVMQVSGPHEGPHAKRSDELAALLQNARTATIDADDAFFAYWHAEAVCALATEFWESANVVA
jgi:pimeloyl-ACP methyl ester carboxylesterase